jgi:membrane protein YdbS with pleckstrin-like domain
MSSRDDRTAQRLADVESSLGPATAAHLRPEVVMLRVRQHARRLIWVAAALVLISAATGVFLGRFDQPLINLAVGLAAAALVIALVLLPFLSWLAQTDTVTSRRIIVRRGFFVRHRQEVSLGRIREVRSKHTLGQRMWGAGDVELMVGADSPLVLRDVPQVEGMVDAMHELIERSYSLDRLAPNATSTLGIYLPVSDTGDTAKI